MRKLTLIAVLLVAFAVPSTAAAKDCSSNGSGGYSNVAGITDGCTVTTSSSGLPFTGLDLGIVLGAGVLLLGAGLVLRRFTGSRQNT